jgi:GxxExxY protein
MTRMNADKANLIHGELTERVIGVFFDVYNTLGHGFLESVYENALAIALSEAGLQVQSQVPISVSFRGRGVGEFRVDLLVADCMIIEAKAVNTLTSAHEAQLLNYLKATKIPVGLLLNFGPRPQFKRRIFTDSLIRVDPRQSVAENDVR